MKGGNPRLESWRVEELKRTREITRCTVQFVLYFIIYWLFAVFFTPSIVSFIIDGIVRAGGNRKGNIFVKQRDEYMYRCDFIFPHHHTYSPVFVTEACTHSSLLRSCPDVFFPLLLLFFVKLKHVILLNYYPFLCLKVSCWKPSNQIKKKSKMLQKCFLKFHSGCLERNMLLFTCQRKGNSSFEFQVLKSWYKFCCVLRCLLIWNIFFHIKVVYHIVVTFLMVNQTCLDQNKSCPSFIQNDQQKLTQELWTFNFM